MARTLKTRKSLHIYRDDIRGKIEMIPKSRMTDKQKIRYLERELHSKIIGARLQDGGVRIISNLRIARKRARSSEREVARLNALVIKLAEKL